MWKSFCTLGSTLSSLRHLHWGEQGLGAEARASEVRPRRVLGWVVWGQPEGMRVWSPQLREYGKEPGLLLGRGGGNEKRGDCNRNFFLCTISGNRAPPTHTPGAGVSLCSHLRLQRQTQAAAAAAAEGPGIGHQLLPPPSWSLCRSLTCTSSIKGITASIC